MGTGRAIRCPTGFGSINSLISNLKLLQQKLYFGFSCIWYMFLIEFSIFRCLDMPEFDYLFGSLEFMFDDVVSYIMPLQKLTRELR